MLARVQSTSFLVALSLILAHLILKFINSNRPLFRSQFTKPARIFIVQLKLTIGLINLQNINTRTLIAQWLDAATNYQVVYFSMALFGNYIIIIQIQFANFENANPKANPNRHHASTSTRRELEAKQPQLSEFICFQNQPQQNLMKSATPGTLSLNNNNLLVHNNSMHVYFDKPLCLHHHLPFLYLCSTPTCPCPARLCSACAQQHPGHHKHKEDLKKDSHFAKQIESQAEAAAKLYAWLEGFRRGVKEGPASKNEESLKTVEAIMLGLSEDKRMLVAEVQNLNTKCFKGLKELKRLQTCPPIVYLSQIYTKQLIPAVVTLSSEAGLQKLRQKLMIATKTSDLLQDMLSSILPYSRQQLSRLSSSQTLLKQRLKACLSRPRGQLGQIQNRHLEEKRVEKNRQQEKRDESREVVRRKEGSQNRIKEMPPSTPKKISLKSARKWGGLLNCDKQN